MAKGDPKFVRLPERLVSGCLGDVEGSGWFIGGRDVQPFPDDEDTLAQRYVRTQLRSGNLEEATQNEHKTVRDASDEMKAMHLGQLDEHEAHDRLGLQEAQLQTLSRRTVNRLDKLRRANRDDDDPLEADQEDRGEVGGTSSATNQQTAGKTRQQNRRPNGE